MEQILLTSTEIAKISDANWDDDEKFEAEISKAAQLKLMEWLFGICNDDSHYHTQNPATVFHYQRKDCPECMAELKKQLEG